MRLCALRSEGTLMARTDFIFLRMGRWRGWLNERPVEILMRRPRSNKNKIFHRKRSLREIYFCRNLHLKNKAGGKGDWAQCGVNRSCIFTGCWGYAAARPPSFPVDFPCCRKWKCGDHRYRDDLHSDSRLNKINVALLLINHGPAALVPSLESLIVERSSETPCCQRLLFREGQYAFRA